MSDTLPFQPHSETSIDAAHGARPTAKHWRARVLASLDSAGTRGLTDEEIQERLRLNPSTERPRRVELVQRGLVRDSGRTRPTESGRQATVWVSIWPGKQQPLFGGPR